MRQGRAESQDQMQLTNSSYRPIEPIGDNLNKPIGNSNRPIGSSKQIKTDNLLELCGDVIHPDYKKWFAKRFYQLREDEIMRAASEARQEGNNPQKLFCYKIRDLTENDEVDLSDIPL